MKNTFGIKRDYSLGMYPYRFKHWDGHMMYLFEIKNNTPYKQILKIKETFKKKDLIFASIDPNCIHHTSMIDAVNPYKLDDEKIYPFYLFKQRDEFKEFYKCDFEITGWNHHCRFWITEKIQFSLCQGDYIPF